MKERYLDWIENKSLQELANGLSTEHPKEMRKIKNGFEEDKSHMQELTFVIKIKEDREDYISILAECVQDCTPVCIQISYSESNNKELIRETLIKEYNKIIIEMTEYRSPLISVGHIF